jgi:dihydroneopterin aldolase
VSAGQSNQPKKSISYKLLKSNTKVVVSGEDNLLVDTLCVTLSQNKQIKKTAVWQKKLDRSASLHSKREKKRRVEGKKIKV